MQNEVNWDWSSFWSETVNQLKARISEQESVMWFGNLEYLSGTEEVIRIAVPSSFYKDQISQRYGAMINETLENISGRKLSVEFHVGNPQPVDKPIENDEKVADIPEKQPAAPSPKPKQPGMHSHTVSRRPGNDILNPDYTFESFVIGDNNSFAANAAYAISKNPGTAYNPCLFYGGVGLGKTHLIQSIGHSVRQDSPELKIVYVTAESFTNEFLDMLKKNNMHQFKNKYRSVDVLLIDDIHFLQSKDSTQEEVFHTFNALYESKKQIVFTCDRPVSELKNLTDRLRSRFERGLNVDLRPPDLETRQAILMKKIESRNISISPEVLELICQNITSNVRDLESALLKLVAYAELVHKDISVDIAREQLKDKFTSSFQTNISVDLIQKIVSDYFNVSTADLKSKKRTKAVTLPRQIAMYILRELTEYSTTEIGYEFGGRDHTTVMHACQRIESRMKTDSTLEPTINNLIRTVKDNIKS
ncbi:MAG: chromosomal replication initiator protein DnaA [Spirochaetales bacterium]|uniref:Chromosomal replication initiator protein DnaA n=1 Tax=Candidatus Thalassospirochaeta sargassi TaxID=3119039 RepID=A0AAJ1MN83_9SPIO|nr:chromosomal replication initiator protein DnaA [Spirochaetales bacterium]